MLMKVVVENGVKKLVPLTADAGSGNPCGTVITTLSNTVPSGYLPLGAQFDTTQFPVLYAILSSDTIPTASALGLPTLSAGRYVIKATSGINENQADNVLSALTPVDQVALNNLHSVTSNATFKACSPNYAQAQLIYGGTDEYLDNYTAPENGIILGSGYGSTSSNSFINLTYVGSGVTVRQQGVSDENISVSMPMRKGDRINIWCYLANNNNGIYFVPYN